jgi:hypothetical protein
MTWPPTEEKGGTERSTLPAHAQHAERKRLRNEIATEIRNDLGMNPADAEWTRVRKETNLKIDTEINLANSTNEVLGVRLALTEASVDQATSKGTLTARIEERMHDELNKLVRNRSKGTLTARIEERTCTVPQW